MLNISICVGRSLHILVVSVLVAVSAPGQATPPGSFTVASKPVAGTLRADTADTYEVRGEASFAPTFASADDVVIGTLTYLIPEEARVKIAQLSGQALEDIPATLMRQDVVANFQEGTTCPDLQLNLGSVDLGTSDVQVLLPDFVLEVKESNNEMIKLLCIWARQIGAGKPRVGVIRAINRLLTR